VHRPLIFSCYLQCAAQALRATERGLLGLIRYSDNNNQKNYIYTASPRCYQGGLPYGHGLSVIPNAIRSGRLNNRSATMEGPGGQVLLNLIQLPSQSASQPASQPLTDAIVTTSTGNELQIGDPLSFRNLSTICRWSTMVRCLSSLFPLAPYSLSCATQRLTKLISARCEL
jgi:hypothetical protein